MGTATMDCQVRAVLVLAEHALETGKQMLGNDDLANRKKRCSAIAYMEEKLNGRNGTVKITCGKCWFLFLFYWQ